MNQSSVTVDREQIAIWTKVAVETIKRWESSQPQKLPPFIKVGRGKVYLLETVLKWLKDSQQDPKAKITPAGVDAEVAAAPASKRGRGRPRNQVRAAAGGAA